ncbi:MAG: broad specificity phosphatase PhoE [Candidatus Latescibacterota bacterium]|jgi:broad specificity phosphatase PhoE
MKRIQLIRHGQSMSQIDTSVSGINPPLSPLGEEQARQLQTRVKDLQPDLVLVSPLQRACRTFQLSGLRGKRIAFNKCLVESNWGRDSRYGDLSFDHLADVAELDPSKNHLLDVRVRVKMLIDEIIESPAMSFVCFAHWGIYSELFNCFFGIQGTMATRALHENTAVSELSIEEDGTRQLVYWNDHTHVPGIAS